MIIWTGWGILVPVVAVAILALTEGVVESIFDDKKYFQSHGWPIFVGLLTVAAILWSLGHRLNRESELRAEVGHTFFFVAIEDWAYIAAVFGLLNLATK